MVNREGFFDDMRWAFGPLSQEQVSGTEHILNQFDLSKLEDTVQCAHAYLAYMLATAYHETAATMQPLSEYGHGKGRAYGKPNKKTGLCYYGRGLVQLTWYDNYKLYGIEKDPDKALDPDVAAHILIDGMVHGRFTGKKLSDYFNAKKNDPVGARRIINGTDRAALVAGYHKKFLSAITNNPVVKQGIA